MTISSFFNFLTGSQTAPTVATYGTPTADQFQTALNAIGTRILQLQAGVTAAGAGAASNATLVQSFNALIGEVQRYQASVTNAGATVNPAYQTTINDLNARLTAVQRSFAAAAATPTAPAATDAFSGGLDALKMQVLQLHAAVAGAGASAASNAQIRASFTALSTQVNAYATALRSAGPAYAASPYQASVNELTARMAQIQAALSPVQPAGYPTGTYPTPTYPTPQYPVPQYPTQQYPAQPYPPQAFPPAGTPTQVYPYPGVQQPGYNGRPQLPGGFDGRPGRRRHRGHGHRPMDRMNGHRPMDRMNGQPNNQVFQTINGVGQIIGALTGNQGQPYSR